MVEPQISALAAQNASPEEIETFEKIGKSIENSIENNEDFSEKDKEFHSHLSNICGNDVISKLIHAIKNRKPIDAQEAMYFHLLYNRNRF